MHSALRARYRTATMKWPKPNFCPKAESALVPVSGRSGACFVSDFDQASTTQRVTIAGVERAIPVPMSDETPTQPPAGGVGGHDDTTVAPEPRAGTDCPGPDLVVVRAASALSLSFAGSTFLVLKLLAVSRLNLNTALALLRTASLTNVAGAAVLVVLPTLGILITDVSAYWFLLNLTRGRGLAAPVIVLSVLTLIQFYFVPWIAALVVMGLPLAVLILTVLLARRFFTWWRLKMAVTRLKRLARLTKQAGEDLRAAGEDLRAHGATIHEVCFAQLGSPPRPCACGRSR